MAIMRNYSKDENDVTRFIPWNLTGYSSQKQHPICGSWGVMLTLLGPNALQLHLGQGSVVRGTKTDQPVSMSSEAPDGRGGAELTAKRSP